MTILPLVHAFDVRIVRMSAQPTARARESHDLSLSVNAGERQRMISNLQDRPAARFGLDRCLRLTLRALRTGADPARQQRLYSVNLSTEP